MKNRTIRYWLSAMLMLPVFTGVILAEEMPAFEMTGMHVGPVTQTLGQMEFTGMATEPKSIKVEPPKAEKK